MPFSLKQTLLHYSQGLLMGSADIIPGVSGGTMALIVGVYHRLIGSIGSFASGLLKTLRGRRREGQAHFRAVHWPLVLPLALGVGTALVLGARVIPHLLETYPVQSRALFFGLIAGSIPIPWMQIRDRHGRLYAVGAFSAVAAFILVGLPPTRIDDPGLLRVFLCASVAICAMILPGISGAFLLYVLGIYEATLLALNGGDWIYVLVFVAGAGIGISAFSKVLSWLLHRHHDVTMAALVGLMAGSLRAIWPWLSPDRGLLLPGSGDPVLLPILLAIGGFAFVTLLTKVSARRIGSAV